MLVKICLFFFLIACIFESYHIKEGRNIVIGDQKETNIRVMTIIIQNGMTAFVAFSMEIFPMEHPTKRADPTGGVVRPIARFSISMIPNWMGSIPRYPTITGNKMGVVMMIRGAISMMLPRTNSMRFTSKINRTLLSVMESKPVVTACGMRRNAIR